MTRSAWQTAKQTLEFREPSLRLRLKLQFAGAVLAKESKLKYRIRPGVVKGTLGGTLLDFTLQTLL
ncbi:MAG TPA: hypothetical protein VFT44_12620, partial [Pyrinomonadaceae bacterium]|nr:hypothetical protein [Pyrinomonadaceae bacterium]